MKTKFTPGPWRFNAYDGSITDCTVGENEIATAQIEDWNVLGMGYANAHLIACAPDMYEMLKLAINLMDGDSIEGFTYQYKEIEQLLKRARGE